MQRVPGFQQGTPRPDDTPSTERSLISRLEWNKPGGKIVHWIVIGALVLLTVTTLGPLFWMLSGALKSSVEIFRTPPSLWPAAPQWSNFSRAWTELNSLLYLGNTAGLAAGAVALQLLVSATAAYSLSNLKPGFSSALLFSFLSTLTVPAVADLILQYLTFVHLLFFAIS